MATTQIIIRTKNNLKELILQNYFLQKITLTKSKYQIKFDETSNETCEKSNKTCKKSNETCKKSNEII